MKRDIAVRGGWDRLRYTLAFEGLLVIVMGTGLALLFEREMTDTGALALVLSLKAMVITFIYNHVYDRVDVRRGRVPTERSAAGRVVHARYGFWDRAGKRQRPDSRRTWMAALRPSASRSYPPSRQETTRPSACLSASSTICSVIQA